MADIKMIIFYYENCTSLFSNGNNFKQIKMISYLFQFIMRKM